MIIGNGFIVSVFNSHFRKDPEAVVFASGVSNSQKAEGFTLEFLCEKQMLMDT